MSDVNPTRFSQIMAWLGALPFIAALVLSLTPYRLHYWSFIVVLVSTYAGLIVTYIAGSHWGFAMQAPQKVGNKAIIWSHLITLLAWVGILFPSWILSWFILTICLWAAYVVDYYLIKNNAYLKMRLQITTLVTFCLCITAFLGRHQL
jgi:Protein of unknown function (DUF3429)